MTQPLTLDLVEKRMYAPTTGNALSAAMNGKCNIVIYDELGKYKNLDEMLGEYGCCFLLYLEEENFGHWTCIFFRDDHTVEYFDSYATYPGTPLDWADKNFKEAHPMGPVILKMLLDFANGKGNEVIWNEIPFQSEGLSATCGLWSLMRLLNRNMTEKQFGVVWRDAPMKEHIEPDMLVSAVALKMFPKILYPESSSKWGGAMPHSIQQVEEPEEEEEEEEYVEPICQQPTAKKEAVIQQEKDRRKELLKKAVDEKRVEEIVEIPTDVNKQD